MKLLLIGGTVFLGRHLVEAALARGHEVAMFNRGIHDEGLFPEVERLRGDRREDLSALRGRSFDAVIDTCGYTPATVRASARLLAEQAGHYTFISSQSVYADYEQAGMDETYAVQSLTDEQVREAEAIRPEGNVIAVNYGAMYGGLKALCERVVEEEMPGRALSIRAGLIVGPGDYSDRFTYWVRRVAAGGEVLAPGEPDRPAQLVDVRDLAEWILHLAEKREAGIFNATGPERKLSMGELLEACRVAASSEATFTWVTDEFLKETGVAGWSEVPLWLPPEDNVVNFFSVDNSKAVRAGLGFRSPVETARATLEWDRTRGTELRAGLKREREAELLRLWHEKQ